MWATPISLVLEKNNEFYRLIFGNVDAPLKLFDGDTTKPLPKYLIQLQKCLKARKWREADQETLRVILQIAKKERSNIGDLKPNKSLYPVLQIIDQLWLNHSNGRFGFSVQKQIWLEYGKESDLSPINSKILNNFGDRVGWRKNGKWKKYDELNFTLDAKAKEGHLPSLRKQSGFDLGLWERRFGGFLSCLENN